MEHTTSRELAAIIAKHHLLEHKRYYEFLVVMEKHLESLT